MVRRNYPPFNGKRFIGNASPDKMEVHDLDNEDTHKNGCQINEIKEVATFTPDILEEAHKQGFDHPCDKCLFGSIR
jgi:hypothetical protein